MTKYIHHVYWCRNDVGRMLTNIMILHVKRCIACKCHTNIKQKDVSIGLLGVNTLCVPHVFGLNMYLY
jgi:hypothetical protein